MPAMSPCPPPTPYSAPWPWKCLHLELYRSQDLHQKYKLTPTVENHQFTIGEGQQIFPSPGFTTWVLGCFPKQLATGTWRGLVFPLRSYDPVPLPSCLEQAGNQTEEAMGRRGVQGPYLAFYCLLEPAAPHKYFKLSYQWANPTSTP